MLNSKTNLWRNIQEIRQGISALLVSFIFYQIIYKLKIIYIKFRVFAGQHANINSKRLKVDKPRRLNHSSFFDVLSNCHCRRIHLHHWRWDSKFGDRGENFVNFCLYLRSTVILRMREFMWMSLIFLDKRKSASHKRLCALRALVFAF